MDITKEVKPFIRRGANTFVNIVYFCSLLLQCFSVYLHEGSGLDRMEEAYPQMLASVIHRNQIKRHGLRNSQ